MKYRIIISVIIGIGLTGGILVVSNPVSLFNKLIQANIWWLLLFIITWILYYVVRSIRLKILLIPIKKNVKTDKIIVIINSIIKILMLDGLCPANLVKENNG